ncbi:alpha/beta hydrolase [Nocardia sp. NPDC058176]|uniref:alpha/beta hydrolase n=1 Tax=Nocardia sp. NPDC058176 TaxID=3346368 RepID=UPI0036DBD4A4
MRGKVPLRMRILAALSSGPDWDSVTPDQVVEIRAAQDRLRGSSIGRLVTGRPDGGARITTHTLELPGRRIDVRMYQPDRADAPLPLIVAFHGGGCISGTPEQDDWLLSHLAAQCPAVVASVDYRLAPEHPLPAAVDDARDATRHLVEQAGQWGADPTRVAVLGASAGATLAALVAIRACERGVPMRTQVLVNPQLDWTERAFDYPSFTENADSPTSTPANCRAVLRLAVPPTLDARTISPLSFDDLTGLAPALIQSVGTDTLEDQATAYAERLRSAGVETTLTGYPDATHAFLSMSGMVPSAVAARAEILAHLRSHLLERSDAKR